VAIEASWKSAMVSLSASDVGPPVQMAVENFRMALEFAVLPAKASLSGLPMPNVGFTMCSK
jgi:hypothetical protein